MPIKAHFLDGERRVELQLMSEICVQLIGGSGMYLWTKVKKGHTGLPHMPPIINQGY